MGVSTGVASADCEDPTGPGCDDPSVGDPTPDPPDTGGGPGGGGGGCDLVVDATSSPDPNADPPTYQTIQAGVDAAGRDDVICIEAGTYRERVSIPDTKTGLALYGVGSLGDTVIAPKGDGEVVLDIDATGVYVSGLDVRAYMSTGIEAASGTTVTKSRVVTGDTIGIEATDSGSLFSVTDTEFAEVSDTEIEEVGRGIVVDGYRGDFANDTGIFVLDCSFEHYNRSVELTDVSDVLVQGNTFTDAYISGLHVASTTDGPPVENVTVRRNEFEGNTLATTFVENGEDGVSDLHVSGNNFQDCYFGVYTSPGGTVTADYDTDGQTVEVPAGGALSEPVEAPCNYWNHPTGPNARSNEFSQRPNVFFADLGSLSEGVQVTGGVDYRPWSLASRTTTDRSDDDLERLVCVGGRRPI